MVSNDNRSFVFGERPGQQDGNKKGRPRRVSLSGDGRSAPSEEIHAVERCDQVGGGHRQDGVQLGESREDQRLTHHIVTVADSGDTVGADLCLIDRSGDVHQTDRRRR